MTENNANSLNLMQQYIEYEDSLTDPASFLFFVLQSLHNSKLNISINSDCYVDTDKWVLRINDKEHSYFLPKHNKRCEQVIEPGKAVQAIIARYEKYDKVVITKVEKHPYEIHFHIFGITNDN